MRTVWDKYYDQISNILDDIVRDKCFVGDGAKSKAFGYWFLRNKVGLNDQEAEECIIDGNDDHGIDAYILSSEKSDENELSIFQFKFPNNRKNINAEITNDAILKLFDGVEFLIDADDNIKTENDGFNELLEISKNNTIYKINIYTVSFNNGVVAQKTEVERKLKNMKDTTGVEVDFNAFDRKEIRNVYDKLQHENDNTITFKYTNMNSSYSIGDSIESWVGTVKANELIEGVHSNLGSIFDENIRLFEKKSNINKEIEETAKNSKSAKMFYFYNNGITFICNKVKVSPGNNTVKLEGAAIVNGCQTVTSLSEVFDTSDLKDDVQVLVRVLKINEYDERQNITQYLNSQNAIKESYFISNNSVVIGLQKELLEHNVYLERQINEVAYRRKYSNKNFDNYKKVYKLEDVIQRYVGAFKNKFASRAKREKSSLFNKEFVESNLSGIKATEVIEAMDLYDLISSICTKYRQNRRNADKKDIINILGYDENEYNSQEFLFINTGDILILNTAMNMKKKYNNENRKKDDKDIVRFSIFLIKRLINDNKKFKEGIISSVTKNKELYEEEQEFIKKSTIEDLERLVR